MVFYFYLEYGIFLMIVILCSNENKLDKLENCSI